MAEAKGDRQKKKKELRFENIFLFFSVYVQLAYNLILVILVSGV